MAIIQSIRNRAGLLLAVVVGVALFAFILGDFITSGGFLYRKSKENVAEINGKKVGYPEYQNRISYIENILKAQYRVSTLDQEMTESARNQVWQDLLQELILQKEYDQLGLAVSYPEFSDLVQGANPHPIIMQMFSNPETGTLDRLQLSEFLNRIEDLSGEPKLIWVYYEKLISSERTYNKYLSLIQKGLYVNSLEAQRRQRDVSTSVDISFIQKPYSSIADSAITVNESEIKKYYNEHQEEYIQEASRDIKYVGFKVVPSNQDYKYAEEWINDILQEFKEIDDVEQYINYTSPPYDVTNYKKGELSDSLDRFMFSADLGDLYGPYFEDNTYKLAKLAKINLLSDSVRVSHIYLPANQSNVQQVRALADSLIKIAKEGHNFRELVQQNSRDMNTVLQGGDLGWIKEGTKGTAFSDSCFFAEKGDVKLTFSQEGYHVVKIMNMSRRVKKIQVGILAREVTPGSETDQNYYKQAVDFLNQNRTLEKFNQSVADNDPMAIPVYGIKPLDREIQGIGSARNIVRWAFEEAEEGDVYDDVDNYGGQYIVAVVTKVNQKGYTPLEDMKETIEIELIKQKKAEKISEELLLAKANSQSIDDIADELTLQVKSATGIRFSSYSVMDAGTEPKLIGAAVSAEAEVLAGPVSGENGVYLFLVDNRNDDANPSTDLKLMQSYIERGYAARANRIAFEKLQDLANIEDNRGRFF